MDFSFLVQEFYKIQFSHLMPSPIEGSPRGGGMAEWFSELGLSSGGPGFKSSTLLLTVFVPVCLEFNSLAALYK